MYALDATTGTLKWVLQGGHPVYCSALLSKDEKTLYFG